MLGEPASSRLERRQRLRQAFPSWIHCRPLAFVCLLFSGWVNRQQHAVIDYLLEENRILRAAHGPQRLRFTNDQRRRLAVLAKRLGRRQLAAIAGIVTPDTILRWYRQLVAKKYDGSEAIVEYKEFPGRTHFTLGQPGWEEVADYALDWAMTHVAERSPA